MSASGATICHVGDPSCFALEPFRAAIAFDTYCCYLWQKTSEFAPAVLCSFLFGLFASDPHKLGSETFLAPWAANLNGVLHGDKGITWSCM